MSFVNILILNKKLSKVSDVYSTVSVMPLLGQRNWYGGNLIIEGLFFLKFSMRTMLPCEGDSIKQILEDYGTVSLKSSNARCICFSGRSLDGKLRGSELELAQNSPFCFSSIINSSN